MRARARDPRDQLANAPELVAGQLGEVLLAQELLPGRAELERIAGIGVVLLAGAEPVDGRLLDVAQRVDLRAARAGGSTGARRNHALNARSNRSSSSWRETSVWRSEK